MTEVPEHLVLAPELTGVDATIVVALGDRFPMIGAHKVLAAYGCLAPRVVTGGFDPTSQRAVWPSTGNYCRGGVAISRIMGCRGVAVLPEGMSRERFDWLQGWVDDPGDIIRTPGTESNVKEMLRRVRAPGTRRRERDPQPVLGVREPPGALPVHGSRPRHRVPVGAGAATGRPSPRVRLRVGIGRHARRRRPPEGRARLGDRGGGGPRVPDDAAQRLR